MNMRKHLFIIFAVAALLLLVGCAANAAPMPAEPAPIAVIPEPSEYAIKIYTMNPEEVIIPDESVPMAAPDEAIPAPTAAEWIPESGTPLTKRQAEALALNRAGLSQSDVSFLYTEKDMDDGIEVFEVYFRSGDYEYEIEIAIETSEIISFEKENWRKD